QRHRAQRRGLEGEVQRLVLGRPAAALIGRRGTDVVKLVVGEPPAVVAGDAGGLAVEQRKAALGGGTDRRLVTGDPAVERRYRRLQLRSNAASAVANSSD